MSVCGMGILGEVARVVGVGEHEVMGGVGSGGRAGRQVLVWVLRRRLGWSLGRIARALNVTVGTVAGSLRAVERDEGLRERALLVAERCGLGGDGPPVKARGLGFVMEALNEVGWCLRVLAGEVLELYRLVVEVDRQVWLSHRVGVEGERRLDRLIAAGWGDVPQVEIPEDVVRDAEAGLFVEPVRFRNRGRSSGRPPGAELEGELEAVVCELRRRLPIPVSSTQRGGQAGGGCVGGGGAS